MSERPPLPRAELVEWLRREGASRYHDAHRVHVLMHEGKLTKLQLQQWVLNRYYYQTRIPIKDAIILSNRKIRCFAALGSAAFTTTTAISRVRAGSRNGCAWPRAWGSTAPR